MNSKNNFGIYKITSPTGKIYIGQTVKSKRRYSDYKRVDCKNQRLLFNSLKKHGFESHIFEMIHILEVINMSKIDIINELNRLEIYYIEFHNSFKDNNENGMNLNKGGNINQVSQETKDKIRLYATGKTPTQETKDKISKANKGKKRTQEEIEAIIKKLTGRKRSGESKKRMSEIMTGKIFTDEHKKNLSESKKGDKSWNYGKKHKEESILKMSEAHKGKKKSPEAVRKSADSKRGKKQSKEACMKKSIASKKYWDEQRKISDEIRKNKIKYSNRKERSEESKEKVRGVNSHNYGKKLTPESIAKREATKKRNRELIEEEKRMMIF